MTLVIAHYSQVSWAKEKEGKGSLYSLHTKGREECRTLKQCYIHTKFR